MEDSTKVRLLTDLAFELRFVDPVLSLANAEKAIDLSRDSDLKKGLARALNTAGLAANALGDYNKAIGFHNLAINEFGGINDSIGIAKALHNIGYAYSIIGENDSTVIYYKKSLEISRIGKNYSLTRINLIKICETYSSLGNYPRALGYAQEALKLSKTEGDLEGLSDAHNEAGLILMYQQNFTAALDYFNGAFELAEKFTDKSFSAVVLNNIGLLYDKKKEPAEAIRYFLKSLKIKEEIGNLQSMVVSYSNIARFYQEKGDYYSAIEYNRKALAVDEQLDDKEGLCIDYLQLAGVELMMKNYDSARVMIEIARNIAEKSGYKDLLMNSYIALSDLFSKQRKFKEAFEYHKLFSQTKDSLLNEKSNRQITEIQTKYETEKKDSEIQLLNKDKEIQAEEIKRQRIFVIAVALVLFLVLSLAFFIYRANRQKQLANIQLERKNKEVLQSKQEIEEKNQSLESANEEIHRKKKEIEEKNEEVMASIRYARRIQQAVLKAEQKITDHLPDHFVLFKPKDIVSGDFYWAYEKRVGVQSSEFGDNKNSQPQNISELHTNNSELRTNNSQLTWYVAAADCTGHGVPGAFLTMLGIAFLNEIVSSGECLSPSDILNELRHRIMKELGQTGKEGESKDGMDISVIALNLNTRELQWAGANNPMYIIAKDETTKQLLNEKGFRANSDQGLNLYEIKADKQPVGYFPEPKPFSNHNFQLQPGDSIFIFSDGYADQFGGPKGKKFKYSQLEKMILSINNKPMEEQKIIFNNEIETWKCWQGPAEKKIEYEQIDDICIIGLRV